jgi:ABC-type phosphate transport system permease subunit
MTALSIILALVGTLAVATAAFLVALPLGLLVAGLEAVLAAYVIRYLEARREAA